MNRSSLNKKLVAGAFFVLLMLLAMILVPHLTQRSPNRKVIGKAGLALVAEQPIEEIIGSSQAAVIGVVADISGTHLASSKGTFFEDALAYRVVTIDVESALFDDIGLADRLELIVLGGEVLLPPDVVAKKGLPKGTEVIRVYEDEAEFKVGEKVLVYQEGNVRVQGERRHRTRPPATRSYRSLAGQVYDYQ
jgi:hypothetical protein